MAALTEEDWRVLRAIDTGAPNYIRCSVVDRLKKLGLLTFSWERRGVVLTLTGERALNAEDALIEGYELYGDT